MASSRASVKYSGGISFQSGSMLDPREVMAGTGMDYHALETSGSSDEESSESESEENDSKDTNKGDEDRKEENDDEDYDERPSFSTFKQPKFQLGPGPTVTSEKQMINNYGIGAKLLSKMGYVPGQGLGAKGEGIVKPVEHRMRPKLMGLGGVQEQSEEVTAQRRQQEKEERERMRHIQLNVSSREQLLTQIESVSHPKATEDESGNNGSSILRFPEIVISKLKSVPDEDLGSDPEYLRVKTMAEQFLKEWNQVQTFKFKQDIEQLAVTQQVDTIIQEIEAHAALKQLLESTWADASTMCSQLLTMSVEYKDELMSHGSSIGSDAVHVTLLQEVSVALIKPVLEAQTKAWNPLDDPVLPVRDNLVQLSPILRAVADEDDNHYTSDCYINLIGTCWLPKVQDVLENQWQVEHPASGLILMEEWASVIPKSIREMLIMEVIVPKLKHALSSSAQELQVHEYIYPWLDFLGTQHSKSIVDEAKIHFQHGLQFWTPDSTSVRALCQWKEVFGREWTETLVRTYYFPVLADYMRTELDVTPTSQTNTKPLQDVWILYTLVKPSTLGKFLETHFFAKWLEILHKWLVSESVDFGEVSVWYDMWSNEFPKEIHEIPLVAEKFKRGLDMMNDVLDYGAEALKTRKNLSFRSSRPSPLTNLGPSSLAGSDVTFKQVVERWCHDHDLLLVQLGITDPKLGYPLYKISRDASKSRSGGLICYISEDVLWINQANDISGNYMPISLDSLANHII